MLPLRVTSFTTVNIFGFSLPSLSKGSSSPGCDEKGIPLDDFFTFILVVYVNACNPFVGLGKMGCTVT